MKRKYCYDNYYLYKKPNIIEYLYCINPLCNHKFFNVRSININITDNIKSLDELIQLGEAYHCKKRLYYSANGFNINGTGINLYKLCTIVPFIKKLNNMIGLDTIKLSMLRQILFLLKYGITTDKNLHTVITGSPGSGKTELAVIMAQIYFSLGLLPSSKIVFAKRSDLIAGYLGQTAIKTQEVIDSALGGVLVIDEAYSLGSSDNRDSFAKECIDTLNQNLLLHKNKLICIIVGYKDALDTCFFKQNEGLRRRFSFWHNIQPYSGDELYLIFKQKLDASGWKYNNENNNELKLIINKNKDLFTYFGGDIDLIFDKAQINSCFRSVLSCEDKIINKNDLNTSINELREIREKEKKDILSDLYL